MGGAAEALDLNYTLKKSMSILVPIATLVCMQQKYMLSTKNFDHHDPIQPLREEVGGVRGEASPAPPLPAPPPPGPSPLPAP